MSCPTCTHTMQRVNEGMNPVAFWCPRCGTLTSRERGDEEGDCNEPKLVQRAIDLCESALDILSDYRGYRKLHGQADPHVGLGIEQAERAVRECCLPPEER